MYKTKESQLLKKKEQHYSEQKCTIKCYHIFEIHSSTISAELVSEFRREKVVCYLIHLSHVIISDDEMFAGV